MDDYYLGDYTGALDDVGVMIDFLDKRISAILDKLFSEKKLQEFFGEYAEKIVQYSGDPNLPEWVRGEAVQYVSPAKEHFDVCVSLLPAMDAYSAAALRMKFFHRLADYLNLSIANWPEIADWKFVVVLSGEREEPKLAFIHHREIVPKIVKKGGD